MNKLVVAAALFLGVSLFGQMPAGSQSTFTTYAGTMDTSSSSSSSAPAANVGRTHVEQLQRELVDGITVIRYHDRESGTEFLCAYNAGCVTTGRNWK